MCSLCRRRHKLHKIVNVLAAMRKCAHTAVKKALAEIWNAEDRTHALAAVKQFNELFGAKLSNAVANITDDLDERPPSTTTRRARDPSAHDEPDMDLRYRPAPHQDHPQARIESRRTGHRPPN